MRFPLRIHVLSLSLLLSLMTWACSSEPTLPTDGGAGAGDAATDASPATTAPPDAPAGEGDSTTDAEAGLGGPGAAESLVIDWQGYGDFGAGEATDCKALQVTADTPTVLVGLCGEALEPLPGGRPQLDSIVGRFAPFVLETESDTLNYNGTGDVAGEAWEQAVLSWVHAAYAEGSTGRACASCWTTLSWFMDADPATGTCPHLTVVSWGHATAERVPCAGGDAELVASDWLETDEWQQLETWSTAAATTQVDSSYLTGTGEDPLSDAEVAELRSLAESIFARLTSQG